MRRLFALLVIAIVFIPTVARADVQLPGRVVRGFEPPAHRYGSGHRGIEFEAEPGSQVLAVADGIVSFAGTVAHQKFVTVRIDRDRLITYAYLATVDVRRGQRVREGQPIGATYGRWHLGLRINRVYADPLLLFRGPARVHLVPINAAKGTA